MNELGAATQTGRNSVILCNNSTQETDTVQCYQTKRVSNTQSVRSEFTSPVESTMLLLFVIILHFFYPSGPLEGDALLKEVMASSAWYAAV